MKLAELKTNVLIALSQKQNFLSSLSAEFSLSLPPPGTPLISYFPERSGSPSEIPIDVAPQPFLTPGTPPVWFSGVPFALGNNPLLVPILNAPAESFAAEADAGADAVADAAEREGEGLWAGSQIGVVAGFQVIGGARITWVGGPEVFSDAFAKKELSKCVWFPFCLGPCSLLLQRRTIWKRTIFSGCGCLDVPGVAGPSCGLDLAPCCQWNVERAIYHQR